MIVNSRNSRGSSTYARNAVPRRRSIFIALMLALTIGSAGQTPWVQAAPASANSVTFELSVAPEKPPMLCTGKPFNLYVAIFKTVHKTINDKQWEIPAPLVSDPDVSVKVVSGPGRILGSLPEGDIQAVFSFISDTPGDTTIKFTASIKNTMVGANEKTFSSSPKIEKTVKLKIRRCGVLATTIGEWKIPGQAKGYVAATSNDAKVKAADPQSPFTGSTSVNWVASVGRVRDCGGAATIGSSKLDWNGTMDESGQLNLNGNFQTASGSFDVKCASGSESLEDSMQFEFTPDPVSISVASSGGTINQSQTLEWEGANPGKITIIIVPIESTGVAVIPGNHEISWDDFSSLFAALIPLP